MKRKQKICLWKKVFNMRPDELPDAVFLQQSSDCESCSGKDESCPDYVEVWENSTPEVVDLKYRAHYGGFDLVRRRDGSFDRL